MPTISKCPKCFSQVSLPDGVRTEALVRCPLCLVEYPLSEALAAVPPMLVVVDPETAMIDVPETSAIVTEGEQVPATENVQALAETPLESADELDVIGFDQKLDDGEEGEEADESGEIQLREDGDEDEDEDEDGEPIDGSAFGVASAATGAGDASTVVPQRPRRIRRRHPIRNAIGMILFSGFGLFLGYYVLNIFGGEQFDFLKIWLPGASHTAKYCPWGSATEAPTDKLANGKKPVNGKKPAKPVTPPQPIEPAPVEPVPLDPPKEPEDATAVKEDGETPSDPLSMLTPNEDPSTVPAPPALPELPPTGIETKPTEPATPQAPKETVPDPATPTTTPTEPWEINPKSPQPLVTEPTPAQPTPPTAPTKPDAASGYIGPKNPPVFTGDDLDTAVKAVRDVFGCANCKSTGQIVKDGQSEVCPVCNGKPKLEMTPEVYTRLCLAAKTATFVQGSDQLALESQKKAVENLFIEVATAKLGDGIAKLAAGPLGDANAQTAGIVLPCTVVKASTAKGLFGLTVEAVDGVKMAVFSNHELPVQVGDRVCIIGCVVNKPAENLVGYPGSKPQIIWGGIAVKATAP